MSSTPLFDNIARRSDRDVVPAPESAPAAQQFSVPCDLVAAIDAIPAAMIASAEREYRISDEQRAMVEALGDSFIRVIVDTLATELERIVSERTIRA